LKTAFQTHPEPAAPVVDLRVCCGGTWRAQRSLACTSAGDEFASDSGVARDCSSGVAQRQGVRGNCEEDREWCGDGGVRTSLMPGGDLPPPSRAADRDLDAVDVEVDAPPTSWLVFE
jgi:hypothetical protein